MSLNKTQIVYVGNRDNVGKEWKGSIIKFYNGKPTFVSDEFAAVLLQKPDFRRLDEAARTMVEIFPKGGKIVICRWGALGDLFMLRAAVAAFRRIQPSYSFALRCQERFADALRHDKLWLEVFAYGSPPSENYTNVISFDQVAEADHRGEDRFHRAELFLRAMTHQQLPILPEHWILALPLTVTQWVQDYLCARTLLRHQRAAPLIALQIRGSGAMKSLPPPVMRRLLDALLPLNVNIMLIESELSAAQPYLIDPRVHQMCHRDPLHGIAMLKEVDLAITFDSGPLWMAHCAPCPVLAILGPTRPEQRINRHPLGHERARAVCLNEIISCPACFEKATACNRRYTCMQNQPDWQVALDQITAAVEDMLTAPRLSEHGDPTGRSDHQLEDSKPAGQ